MEVVVSEECRVGATSIFKGLFNHLLKFRTPINIKLNVSFLSSFFTLRFKSTSGRNSDLHYRFTGVILDVASDTAVQTELIRPFVIKDFVDKPIM